MDITIQDAINRLSGAMEEDPEYAWGWHCNIAVMMQDAGADYATANEGAARFMKLAFGVDTRRSLSASEALYGFAGWLTSRQERTVMSSADDAAPIADLVKEFCKVNSLGEPREGWANRFVHPDGKITSGKRKSMTWIPPLLTKTVVTDGKDDCTHPDTTHIRIEVHKSGDQRRPYEAIETSRCKLCNGLIHEHWLTAYENYIEGRKAMNGTL